MEGADTPRSPVPRALGVLVEPLYRAVIAARNRSYDSGRGVIDVGVPVVSVGNLSVGGSGKTPMVMRIVEWLLESGRRPAIAMRGYKARLGEQSDEEAEYHARFVGVPIVAQPDRVAGIRPLVHAGSIDCVVLDDGFQHRKIRRALDIVMIDVTRQPFVDRCLPAGWLREPVSSLERADMIALTHTECLKEPALESMRQDVQRHTGRAPTAEARHVWDALLVDEAQRDVRDLSGRRVIIACAIGNPAAFVEGARRAGAEIAGVVKKRDHHLWSAEDARELSQLARAQGSREGGEAMILTTEKDWVKIRHLCRGTLPEVVARPRLRMEFSRGEATLKEGVLGAVCPDRL